MQETPEELDALQALLDQSIATRNRHLLGIVRPERRLSASQIATELTGMKVLVVATVTAAGEPRTSCLDGHFMHGAWVFSTDASAVKARHIKARPAVSATHVDGERLAVFAHGNAEYIDQDSPDFAPLDAYFTGYYGSSPTTWGPNVVFFRLHATWMLGYAADAESFPQA
ncbi:MAG TPA: pyridoxamine 5'-phosphate oxidase family protein [Micromonosporaceae bacterium]|nr:pyridoxamine 5'-phosphate oxidase family protein [Micromonosporaceae bacterium]